MKIRTGKNRQQGGYVLLVLLLFMALLSIAMMMVMESIEFQIRRDREEEFIHRGVEYSRAVRKYVKQFGRYPTSIESLENSNDLRFLRRRYKDPLTRRDFKLIYYGDPESFSHSRPASDFGIGSAKLANSVDALPKPAAQSSIVTADLQDIATDPEGAISSDGMRVPEPDEQSQADASAQEDGGRAIIGVASYSKRETIRIFNRKNHYDQWQFVYDPSNDAGPMKTPNQPLLRGTEQLETLQNEQKLTSNLGMSETQK